MSRGLGEVERYVLAYLSTSSEGTAADIAGRRQHDRWLAREGRVCDDSAACCNDWVPSTSERESVRRPMRSLERKGLLFAFDTPRQLSGLLLTAGAAYVAGMTVGEYEAEQEGRQHRPAEVLGTSAERASIIRDNTRDIPDDADITTDSTTDNTRTALADTPAR